MSYKPYKIIVHQDVMKDLLNIEMQVEGKIAMNVSNQTLVQTHSDNKEALALHIAEGMVKELKGAVYEEVVAHLQKVEKTPKTPITQLKALGPMNAYIGDEITEANLAIAKAWMPEPETYFTVNTSGTNSAALYDKFYDGPKVSGSAIVMQLKNVFPEAFIDRHPCPACNSEMQYPNGWLLDQLIQHLNDADHQWSREQIADWLETLDVNLNAKDIDIDKEEENDD